MSVLPTHKPSAEAQQQPVISNPAYPGPNQPSTRAHTQSSSFAPPHRPSVRRPSIASHTSNPPIDIVSVLDPASAGGGGPLKRIETARSERYIQEAREREQKETSQVGIGRSGSGGFLRRFRSHSIKSKRDPSDTFGIVRVPLSPHHSIHDEEDHISIVSSHAQIRDGDQNQQSSKAYARTGDGHEDEGKEPDEKVEYAVPTDEEMRVDMEDQEQLSHVYPDGGYGWVVVLCCLTLAGCTMGLNMNYSVFQEHYANVVFPEEKTSVLSLGGSLCAFGMNFSAFLSGRVGDRYGFKRVLFTSTFLSWLGLFLASWSTKVWQLVMTQGVICGLGFGLAMPLFMSLPSQWFYKRRGLASGIAIGGAGVGGGTSVLLARQLITSVGYQRALLIFSFLVLFFMTLATLFIRTRPTSPEAQTAPASSTSSSRPWFDKGVVKTSAFWSIAVATFVGTLGYGTPYTLFTQFIRSKLPNLDPILLAVPPTVMGYMVAVGRALVGYVADLIGPLNTYILVFVISGIIQLTLWYTASNFAGMIAFAICFGLVAPGYAGLLPQIVVQLFGPANLATNVGLILLCSAPGGLITGPMGGALYDASGRTTFSYAIAVSGSFQVAGGIIALWARLKTSRRVLAKV